jgi:hypothetical protein
MANEMRLIDANALEAHFHETKMIEIFPYWKELSFKTQSELLRFGKALKEMMQNAPTVDAVEVVHGMWQERRFICMDSEVMLGYRCSKCKLTFDVGTNYCPNCGAKMDGGN